MNYLSIHFFLWTWAISFSLFFSLNTWTFMCPTLFLLLFFEYFGPSCVQHLLSSCFLEHVFFFFMHSPCPFSWNDNLERVVMNNMEFLFVGWYVWMDEVFLHNFRCRSWQKCVECTWSWSWEYEMYLTMDRNNLTKLNEITSCICRRFSILNNIWPWIGIS